MSTNEHPVHLIETTRDFNQCCQSWSNQQSLAIDTEFIRTNTFYPKPGLLQFADTRAIYLVDPLCIEDWSGFIELLQSPSLLWVLHSGSEDLVLLQSFFKALPSKLFDTQIAAAYAGLGFSLSYQSLVQKLQNVDLPKGETRSDWLRRPLRSSQLHYAASDVRYLLPIHNMLLDTLSSTPKTDWMAGDMIALLHTVADSEDPIAWQTLYAAISGAWHLPNRGLMLLQALCVWREREAREQNKPRLWLAKDNELLAIAARFGICEQINHKEFYAMDDLSDQLKRIYGKALLRLLETPPANEVDRDLLPPPLSNKYRRLLKEWRQIVLNRAGELNIAPELLARKRWLQDLLRGYEKCGQLNWVVPMKGWRQRILQKDFECTLNITLNV